MYFRRYYNLAYSSAYAKDINGNETLESNGPLKQQYYTGVPSGYMHSANHKVKFGVTDYRVARSHKYGNVCRDCAGILDTAPGLFMRNSRWQFSGGLVTGNSEAVEASQHNYWMLMFGKMTNTNDTDAVMDDFLTKGIELYTNNRGRQARKGLSRLDATERQEANDRFDAAAAVLAESINARHKFPTGWTRLVAEPSIHVQGGDVARGDRKPDDIAKAIKTLGQLFKGVDPNTIDFTDSDPNSGAYNPALKDIVKEAERKYIHNEAYARVDYTKQFDSDVRRTEYRNCTIRWSNQGLVWLNGPGGETKLPMDNKTLGKFTEDRFKNGPVSAVEYYNCLITDQFDPDLIVARDFSQPRQKASYRQEVYLANRKGARGEAEHPESVTTQWKGDGFVCDYVPTKRYWQPHPTMGDGRALVQYRPMRQSRLFITYSLHRAITDENQGRVILERMAEALYTLFGTDRWLSEMIVFGKMLKGFEVGVARADNLSKSMWSIIDRTKKNSAMDGFYGNGDTKTPRTSYVYDTYETHVDKLSVDAGCEIGPKMGHPHFHLLLTIDHFSYVQFDYFKMNTYLEIMFRGVETFHNWGKKFMLPGQFYGDNENPFVDIKLYPQDNWKEIIAAYVRKNAIPSIVEVENARRLPGTAAERRRVSIEKDKERRQAPGF
jgi:hypothetical protein